MKWSPPRLVLQPYTAWRSRWGRALMAGVGVLSLVVAFALGRVKTLHDSAGDAAQLRQLRAQVAQLTDEQRDLRVQAASADQIRISDARERGELSHTIGDLQSEIERLQQQVEFYKAMTPAGQAGAGAPSIRLQPLHIVAVPSAAGRYTLRVSLVRVSRPGQPAEGAVALSVEGQRDGHPMALDLRALTGAGREIMFNFRYTTAIEQIVNLPPNFRPERVTIEVRPSTLGLAPLRQSFPWNVDPA